MQEALLNYGLPGIVIGGLAIYVVVQDKLNRGAFRSIGKDHREERNEWRVQCDKQFDKIVEVTEKNNEAQNRNTAVVNELKGIIKSINNK